MKVGVLGAGAWGSALSLLAHRGGCNVTAWSYNNEFDNFHGVPVPADMRLTDNMADMADMDARRVFPSNNCRRARALSWPTNYYLYQGIGSPNP